MSKRKANSVLVNDAALVEDTELVHSINCNVNTNTNTNNRTENLSNNVLKDSTNAYKNNKKTRSIISTTVVDMTMDSSDDVSTATKIVVPPLASVASPPPAAAAANNDDDDDDDDRVVLGYYNTNGPNAKIVRDKVIASMYYITSESDCGMVNGVTAENVSALYHDMTPQQAYSAFLKYKGTYIVKNDDDLYTLTNAGVFKGSELLRDVQQLKNKWIQNGGLSLIKTEQVLLAISIASTDQDNGASWDTVFDIVDGKAYTFRNNLAILRKDGFVERAAGTREARLHLTNQGITKAKLLTNQGITKPVSSYTPVSSYARMPGGIADIEKLAAFLECQRKGEPFSLAGTQLPSTSQADELIEKFFIDNGFTLMGETPSAEQLEMIRTGDVAAIVVSMTELCCSHGTTDMNRDRSIRVSTTMTLHRTWVGLRNALMNGRCIAQELDGKLGLWVWVCGIRCKVHSMYLILLHHTLTSIFLYIYFCIVLVYLDSFLTKWNGSTVVQVTTKSSHTEQKVT